MKKSVAALLVLSWCACGLSPGVQAQERMKPQEDYAKRIRAAEMVGTLNSDLFGDNVSLYNGATEFAITDIDLPGNDGLPVQLRRRFSVESRKEVGRLGGFGVWDLDVPYLYGTFGSDYKWNQGGASGHFAHRCSQNWYPRVHSQIELHEIWSGTRMHIPGEGDNEMLHMVTTGNTVPNAGGPYGWGTRNDYRFSCKSATANGYPGEGFIAVAPNGTRYTFDVAIEKVANPIEKGYQAFGRVKIYMLASRVEDRHGNWVRYNYSGDRLVSITASDGRAIQLTYTGNRITRAAVEAVDTGTREWTYQYGTGTGYPNGDRLDRVVLPDGTDWKYQYAGPLWPYYPIHDVEPDGWCVEPPPTGDEFTFTATHPSGAVGSFEFSYTRHGRSGVPRNGCVADGNGVYALHIANFFDVYSLRRKTISGSGVAQQQWGYGYGSVDNSLTLNSIVPCTSCQQSKTVAITQPDGSQILHGFGVLFGLNDGRLLEISTRSPGGATLRTQTNHYVTEAEAPSMPFPDLVGTTTGSDDWSVVRRRPVRETTIVQQGVTFSSRVDAFDSLGRPLTTTKSSSLPGNPTRTEVVQYHDHLGKWVLGQPAKLTVDGSVTSETSYHATSVLPSVFKQFGKTVQTLTYNANGTVATVKDGNNNVTTLSNWKRGIPQTIRYPATPEASTGATQSAVVNSAGWITRITDENGFATNYQYDPMGRLARIDYPTGDSTAWNATTFTFAKVTSNSPPYSLPVGHWQHTIASGNGRKVTYLDALWRPILVREYDTGNASGTQRFTKQTFDHEGRVTFASYPSASGTPATGTWTEYDALGRVTSVTQDSELLAPLDTLITRTAYLSGFRTRVTSPKNAQTITSYLAWDQPTTEFPVAITHPGGAFTDIARDGFGKPTALIRRNSTGSVSLTRSYVYDAHQQLCKSIEPETGATVMAYDGAGNLSWSASGQNYPSTSACNTSNVAANQKVARTYDARNRVRTLTFPDGRGNTTYSYTPDGLPSQVTVGNGGSGGVVTTAYTYNKRRLPVGEALGVGPHQWGIGTGYNANGHLNVHTLPGGLTLDYAPNALGQPTKAGSYASSVSYFPNGALKQFTYGNGAVHTLTQNARGLPERSRDVRSGTAIRDDSLDYDAHGNVAAISDGLANNRGNRTMAYDALDRLTQTVSPMFGTASYSYDVLDNLRTVRLTAGTKVRNHTYGYDASYRLTDITNTSGGATAASLSYDAQGNLASKNGQAHSFDFGNRLREVPGVESYRYDGHGRRVQAIRNGASIYSIYGQDGVLRFQRDERTGKSIEYVHLGGSLVAQLEDPIPLATPTLTVPGYSASGSYTVSWTSSALASKYQLQEQINGGSWSTIHDAAGTSKALSGKPAGSYGYRVRACSASTCGSWSVVQTVTVQLAPATAPSLNVPGTGLNGSYTVTWGSVAAADTYQLQERQGSGSWTTIHDAAGTSKAISGKAAGNWSYQARGCNAAGCGPWSATATVNVVHPPTGVPTLTVPATSYTGSYTISWNSVSTATRYELDERLGTGNWSQVHNAAAASKAITGKAAGNWGYRVRACNAAGCGGYSAIGTVAVTLPPTGVPTLTAPASNYTGSYTVSWTAVSVATRYQLQERLGSGSWSTIHDAAGSSKAITGKATGTWGYRIRACNVAGCGAYSGVQTTQVTLPPAGAPTLSAPSSNTTGSYTVSWGAVEAATGYQLQQRKDGGSWSTVHDLPTTSRSFSGQAAGTYDYRGRGCNIGGCGPYSSIRTVSVTLSAPPASAPNLVVPGIVQEGVAYTVSWSTVTGAGSYRLEQQFNGGTWFELQNAAATSMEFPGGSGAGIYRFRVRACNASGCGPYSAAIGMEVIGPSCPVQPCDPVDPLRTGEGEDEGEGQ